MSGCCGSASGGGLLSAFVQGLRLPWSLAVCSLDAGGRMATGMWSMVLPPGLGDGAPGEGGGGRGDLRPQSSPPQQAGPPSAVPFPFGQPAAGGAGFDLSSNRAVEFKPPSGGTTAAHSIREEAKMSDVSLSDDMVKLVQFAIVSVRRDIYDLDAPEEPLFSSQEVISDNLRDSDFSSYIIARYCDRIPKRDQRYIRVWYQVLDRWPKSSLNYEERQLRELRRIANCVCGEEDEGPVRRRAEERDEEGGGEAGGGGRPAGGARGRQRAQAGA